VLHRLKLHAYIDSHDRSFTRPCALKYSLMFRWMLLVASLPVVAQEAAVNRALGYLQGTP
jgi:hypothetical protein